MSQIIDEVVVRIVPGEFDGGYIYCTVKVLVTGKKELVCTKLVSTNDFETMFHRFMRITEEEMVRTIKKEWEEQEL